MTNSVERFKWKLMDSKLRGRQFCIIHCNNYASLRYYRYVAHILGYKDLDTLNDKYLYVFYDYPRLFNGDTW